MIKRVLLAVSVVIIMSTTAAIAGQTGQFRLTAEAYSEKADLNAAIQNELGAGWRLADWSDILQVWNSDRDAFPELMSIIEGGTRFVTYYGNDFWSGNRHYIVGVHNHSVPSGWLVHAHIDNHLVDLGSWYNPHMALAYSAVVPEPSTFLALVYGLTAAFVRRVRKMR